MDALIDTWICIAKDDRLGMAQQQAKQKLLRYFGSTQAVAEYIKSKSK